MNPKPLRLEWIEAGTLQENRRNWRKHPEGQVAALKQILADPEVGRVSVEDRHRMPR